MRALLVQHRQQIRNRIISIVCVDSVGTRELRPAAQRIVAKPKTVVVEIRNIRRAAERVIAVCRLAVIWIGHVHPIGSRIVTIHNREGIAREERVRRGGLLQPAPKVRPRHL